MLINWILIKQLTFVVEREDFWLFRTTEYRQILDLFEK